MELSSAEAKEGEFIEASRRAYKEIRERGVIEEGKENENTKKKKLENKGRMKRKIYEEE